MIYFMFLIDGIVSCLSYDKKAPGDAIVISNAQYISGILGMKLVTLPTYNEDGTVLTDAVLTEA